jgi:hypothetical protein
MRGSHASCTCWKKKAKQQHELEPKLMAVVVAWQIAVQYLYHLRELERKASSTCRRRSKLQLRGRHPYLYDAMVLNYNAEVVRYPKSTLQHTAKTVRLSDLWGLETTFNLCLHCRSDVVVHTVRRLYRVFVSRRELALAWDVIGAFFSGYTNAE